MKRWRESASRNSEPVQERRENAGVRKIRLEGNQNHASFGCEKQVLECTRTAACNVPCILPPGTFLYKDSTRTLLHYKIAPHWTIKPLSKIQLAKATQRAETGTPSGFLKLQGWQDYVTLAQSHGADEVRRWKVRGER
eukprot:1158015-Pelagomonas_calceolata.AAC.10